MRYLIAFILMLALIGLAIPQNRSRKKKVQKDTTIKRDTVKIDSLDLRVQQRVMKINKAVLDSIVNAKKKK